LPDSTRELCSAIASGDPGALARFYEEQFDFMFACARRASGRDESICLDIVHDAMLRVMRSIPKSIDSETELRAWLARVVPSCALDTLRSEQRRRARETRASAREAASGSPAPQSDLDERIAWLRSELDAQGDQTAALIRLRHALGWTLARIGRAFNLSPGAVDGRISRALSTMRENAREKLDEP